MTKIIDKIFNFLTSDIVVFLSATFLLFYSLVQKDILGIMISSVCLILVLIGFFTMRKNN